MKNDYLAIQGKFQTLMDLARQLDRSPKKFGTDELMSHSEIHLIEIIGDTKDSSVTDISRYFGITKGAVSQALKKLEKKGFTYKQTDPENLSRSIVMLTAKGQTAYWAHKHWHQTMDGGFLKYIQEMEPRDLKVVVSFLEKVEDFLHRRVQSPE